MDRELILLSGLPGSGKSHLGHAIVDNLHDLYSIEHISLGDRMRAIGGGAISSVHREDIKTHLNGPHRHRLMNDEIAYTVSKEALEEQENTDIVLLDGFPRRTSQIASLEMLTVVDQRLLQGVIVTHTDKKTAVSRLMKRSQRDFENTTDYRVARRRIDAHEELLRPTLFNLFLRGVRSREVDTSGPKVESLAAGLAALAELRGTPDMHE